MIPQSLTHQDFSWSECRDSNSRPLGPEPSAIPNFATPRKYAVCNQSKPKCINGLPDFPCSLKCSSCLVLAVLSCLTSNQVPLSYRNIIAHFGRYVKPFLPPSFGRFAAHEEEKETAVIMGCVPLCGTQSGFYCVFCPLSRSVVFFCLNA